VIVYTV